VILIAVRDLLFRSKIDAAAHRLGVEIAHAPREGALAAAVEARRPSLLLADLSQPGALDALRDVRALAAPPRIVGYLGHLSTDLMDQARALGVDEVLTRGQLAGSLDRVLSSARGSREPFSAGRDPTDGPPQGGFGRRPAGGDGKASAMAGSTVEVTEANFKQVVERDGIVLLDWWAPWCGPCRAFGPTYERVAAKHPDAVFGKVNTEEQQQLAGAFDIRSIPTLMILRDQVLVYAEAGALPEAALEELVTKVRGLDMDDVRRQLAAAEAKAAEGKATPEPG
jgi:thioredoxin